MKKWNSDFDRRSRIDRRSGIDRRLSNDLDYFSSGEIERRSLNERRSDGERRSDWFRISRFCSVYMADVKKINITGKYLIISAICIKYLYEYPVLGV